VTESEAGSGLRDLAVIGWDIGGANIKAARLTRPASDEQTLSVTVRPFEIWRDLDRLNAELRSVADELHTERVDALAVTMTAELSDAFRTKRQGVSFVLDALAQALPDQRAFALDVSGHLVTLAAARTRPLDFAATNWLASALLVAERLADCVLVDVGSTTADIVPVRGGRVATTSRTDPERLIAGELVYTGVLRTNPNTLTQWVPLRGHMCRVAAEYFTVMADVYLVLGRLSEADYTIPTPDGRARTRRAAVERLARLVCADSELVSEEEIGTMALYLFERQVEQVTEGLAQVLAHFGRSDQVPLVAAGVGSFVAAEAGRRLGLGVIQAEELLGETVSRALPASAVARLLAKELAQGRL